jgi:hypothetical protein
MKQHQQLQVVNLRNRILAVTAIDRNSLFKLNTAIGVFTLPVVVLIHGDTRTGSVASNNMAGLKFLSKE